MSAHPIFTIPDFTIFATIIHSFIKFHIGGLPIIIGFCRYIHSEGLKLIEWHWDPQFGPGKKFVEHLKKAHPDTQQGLVYVAIFESYIQNLLLQVISFLNINHQLGNQYSDGQLFTLEIDIKLLRRNSNFFHHDGGWDGGDIDVLGFSYMRSDDLFENPRDVQKTDITLVLPKQEIEPGTVVSNGDQAEYGEKSITERLREDQIIFFNNHRYLHAAPASIPMCQVRASDKKCSRTILIRFTLTKRRRN